MASRSSAPPPFPGRRATLKDYLKSAFLYRWNMLLFLGGVAAAALSPWPDAVLPLVGAAEAVYLGGIVASEKFRKAIDAKLYQEERKPIVAESERTLQNIIEALPAHSRQRFERLRGRCIEMRSIAEGVRGRGFGTTAPAPDHSTGALDRLLWVFLRLLVSQEALERFLKSTDADEIRSQLEEANKKLQASADNERLKRSLQDSIAVQKARLENYQKAEANAEYAKVELNRIEAKIHALTEASVSRQDAEYLSSQIDSVAESMQSTEEAISELQQITGLVDQMQEPPAILAADIGGTVTH